MNLKDAKIKYICPNCFLIQDSIKGIFSDTYEIGYLKGEVVKEEFLDGEFIEVIFSECKHNTKSYGIEELEVYIDEENKEIEIISDFKEYEEEIKKVNPKYKDYKFIFD